MSAFVISTETMDSVVSTLCAKAQWGHVLGRFADESTDQPGAATRIGRKLYAMNIAAVEERYRHHGPSEARGLEESYTAKVKNPTALAQWVAGFKAIGCLSYQCNEGDVPDSDLFKELELAEGKIAARIVGTLPEYEKAPWG